MSRHAIHALTTLLANADKLGAAVPKAIRAEHEALIVLADRVRDMQRSSGNAPSVSDAVLDALAAGVDPATDETVRKAVVSRTVAEHTNGVDDALGARADAFLRANADKLLQAFVPVFDKAAATIAAALEQLGDVDLDDTAAVLGRGGDSASLWAQIQDAERVIAQVRTVREQLTAGHPVDPRYTILGYAAVPPDEFIDGQLGGAQLKGWQVVRRGWELSLATPTVLRERIDAVGAEVTARQQAGEQGFQAAVRRRYGSGVAS